MIEGVDFSWARPGGAALVAAGKKFVVRYVPYTGDGGKGLTAAEIADYRAHGIAICLVFESSASRARSGYNAGVTDAKTAQAALANLKMPLNLPIYFAVDWDAQASEQPAIDAYLNGAASVIGASRVGVYGGYRVIIRCRANNTAKWFWQTYAWSGGLIAPSIHLYQYKNGQILNGGAVDLCRAYPSNYGQWEASNKMDFKFRVERWTLDGGPALVTTVGEPLKADGTVDWSQRLALVSGAGGANPRLVLLPRTRLVPVTADLSDTFYQELSSYAVTVCPPDTSPFTQHDIDDAVAAQALADENLRLADLAAMRESYEAKLAQSAAECSEAMARATEDGYNDGIDAEQERMRKLLGLQP